MTVPLKFFPPHAIKARRTTRILLPIRPVNNDAVRSFMHDYMVPVLAKEFLRLRDATPSVPTEVRAEKQTSRPVDKEDGL